MASSRYLSRIKPDLSVGFGSYVSFPGVWLSVARKIPALIHEQNVVPGKATQWLARKVDTVSVTFDATYASQPLRRRRVVGLPLRPSLLEAGRSTKRQLPKRPFRVLIVGGSQGAHRLNAIVLENFSRWSSREKSEIAVTHITGNQDLEWVRKAYQDSNLNARTYAFFDKMYELYRENDLAITRAGANTLFELALFHLPAIVIPYPHAGGHQRSNAEFFLKHHAILSQSEDDLMNHQTWLGDQVKNLKDDPAKWSGLSGAVGRLATPRAGECLVDCAEELLAEKASAKKIRRII